MLGGQPSPKFSWLPPFSQRLVCAFDRVAQAEQWPALNCGVKVVASSRSRECWIGLLDSSLASVEGLKATCSLKSCESTCLGRHGTNTMSSAMYQKNENMSLTTLTAVLPSVVAPLTTAPPSAVAPLTTALRSEVTMPSCFLISLPIGSTSPVRIPSPSAFPAQQYPRLFCCPVQIGRRAPQKGLPYQWLGERFPEL